MSKYSSAEGVFENFSRQRILVIGDVMVDSYIWGAVERISPEAPVPIVRTTKKDFRLGGAGNVALNIAALNATPVLCTLVGDDDDGKKILNRMKERDLPSEGVVISKSRPTTVKTRILSGHQHVVRLDEESDKQADRTEIKALKERIDQLLPECNAIIFEDYDKGVISKELINHVVVQALEKNIPVVVDPKKRNFLHYHNVDLFKPNLKELREGLKIDSLSDIEEVKGAVKRIKSKLGVKGVLTTLSEKGAYIDYHNEIFHAPAHVREISDVSGAGDTVVSVAALCVAIGLPAKLIAQLSNLAGGLVIEHLGVVPIDKEDFLREAKQFF
ncbi:MAG: bifunctional heptose 7-phosphate kinase/heptose 1-phosphate adenyltransferase [Candidatus Cyclobacteriaceae bacterium M2_1C_046]